VDETFEEDDYWNLVVHRFIGGAFYWSEIWRWRFSLLTQYNFIFSFNDVA